MSGCGTCLRDTIDGGPVSTSGLATPRCHLALGSPGAAARREVPARAARISRLSLTRSAGMARQVARYHPRQSSHVLQRVLDTIAEGQSLVRAASTTSAAKGALNLLHPVQQGQ